MSLRDAKPAALAALALLAAASASRAEETLPTWCQTSTPSQDWTTAERDHAWESYTANVAEALGVFPDIPLYRWSGERWTLQSGQFLPMTVDGKTPERYETFMRADRPMTLPTNFTGWDDQQGQSIPYGVSGRMAGENPEVQWTFLARHYEVKDPKDEDFPVLHDVAAIGHHPRTGASAFFQFYFAPYGEDGPVGTKNAETIPSPWSAAGQGFWNDVPWVAQIDCGQCHSADPFIHTPWITQARIGDGPGAETVVPANPLGPFFYIGAEAEAGGENLFADWDKHLVQLADPENACISCHRISQANAGIHLYADSTHGAYDTGWPGEGSLEPIACAPDPARMQPNEAYCSQSESYRRRPWMPPVNLPYGDFYAGQPGEGLFTEPDLDGPGGWPEADLEAWRTALGDYRQIYGEDATAVLKFADCIEDKRAASAPIPAPPEEQRTIMAPRAERDVVAAGAPLLIVDTRMRVNADGPIDEWRFLAAADAPEDMRAAPALLSRVHEPDGALRFRVEFVGDARGAAEAGDWIALSEAAPSADAETGWYLGLVLSRAGDYGEGPGLVPFSADGWAAPVRPAAFGFLDGVMTVSAALDGPPAAAEVATLGDPAFRTYSFEFRRAR